MTMGNRVTAACWLLMMLACALCLARPQAAAQETRDDVLALTVADDVVPPAALQGALESELGVGVALTGTPAANAPHVTVTRLSSGYVEVALQSRTVPRATRQLELTAELESERVETLALIAANLVRNEAASLLPQLRPATPKPEEPAPAAPEASGEAPKPTEPSPCDLAGPGGFGFDLAPGVGSSSSPEGRSATRAVSLGIAGNLSGFLHGFELSIGANIERRGVCGAQFAVGANVALGSVSGAQFAYFNLAKGRLHGTQFGLANMVTGRAHGVQGGLVNGAGLGLDGGAQLGLVAYAGGEGVRGAQLGLVNLAVGGMRGAQLGLANVGVGVVHGAQLGLVNVATRATNIGQVGIANVVTHDAGGVQFSIVNVATGSIDTQIGVINYAERSDASIGALSIVRRGRTSVDATAAIESGVLMAGVTHGGRVVHSILGLGGRIDDQDERLAAQLGIGVRAMTKGRVTLDVDLLGTHLFRTGHYDEMSVIAGVRVPVTIALWDALGLMIAPSYQVLITRDPEERATPLFGHSVLYEGEAADDPYLLGYPGLTVGLRYQFHHGL